MRIISAKNFRTKPHERDAMQSISSVALRTIFITAFALALAAPAQPQLGPAPTELFESDALRVLVCGSASPLGNVPDRAQACIAVIAGPRMFLVDTGSGSAKNLGVARLPMDRLAGVLLTHYHSDHIGDLPAVNLSSWISGRDAPLEIMGPEGVSEVVDGFNKAYALDRSYRTAHHGEEILPAKVGPMASRTIESGVILDDGGLKITAFPVDHAPIEPAFGYRFDFLGRSVVVSGDTVATDTLANAAKGIDLLLHDAMALPMVQQIERMMESAGNHRTSKILKDVQDYHAPLEDIFKLAQDAGVRQVALYHLVPAPANATILKQFTEGMPENAVVTNDGMLFELAEGTETVERRQLFEP